MNGWINLLNANSGAIQAISTILLVGITTWYAIRTHQLTSLTRRQINIIEKAQQPDILVSLQFAMVNYTGQVVDVLSIAAANRGQLPVTLNIPFIKFSDGRSMVFTDFFHKEGNFPQRLEPGDGCSVLIRTSDVLAGLLKAGYTLPVNIEASYRDKVDNIFASKPFKFDPDDFRP